MAWCYMTPPPQPPSSWKPPHSQSPSVPFSERKKSPNSANKIDLFHIIHKVPAGDSPYVKAKQVQVTWFFSFSFCVEFGCYFFWGALFLLVFLHFLVLNFLTWERRFLFLRNCFCFVSLMFLSFCFVVNMTEFEGVSNYAHSVLKL